MDIKVSAKEKMYQPNGPIDVLVSGIFDFFLKEHTDEAGRKWIDDVEVLDNLADNNMEEELDRVTFAVIRQKGQDPMDPSEGVQWAEAMLSEIPIPLLMSQISSSAVAESAYVNVSFQSIPVGPSNQLAVKFNVMGINQLLQRQPNV